MLNRIACFAALSMLLLVPRAATAEEEQPGAQTQRGGAGARPLRRPGAPPATREYDAEDAAESLRLHRDRERAEDMEVMSRILVETVRQAYGLDAPQEPRSDESRRAGRSAGIGARETMSGRGGSGRGSRSGDMMADDYGYGMPGGTSGMSRYGSGMMLGGGAGTAPPTRSAPPQSIQKPLSMYLEGYGVVFQLEAPAPREPVRAPEAKQEECPFLTASAWERTRLELRDELTRKFDCLRCHGAVRDEDFDFDAAWPSIKPGSIENERRTGELTARGGGAEKAAKSAEYHLPPTRDRLVDILLATLAENGHNFRHLADDGRLAIAVTFRSAVKRPSAGEKVGDSNGDDAASRPTSSGFGGLSGRTPGYDEDYTEGYDEDAALRARSRGLATRVGILAFRPGNDEVTGDLHLRQGNYQKAIEAYERELKHHAQPGEPMRIGALELGQVKMFSPAHRRLYGKLVQAHVGAGELDKAQEWLEKLRKAVAAERPSDSEPAAKAEPSRPALPLPALDVVFGILHNLLFIGAGLVGAALTWRKPEGSLLPLGIASGAVLFHQGLLQVAQLGASQLATVWPTAVIRALVALSVGQALWVAVMIARALRAPSPQQQVGTFVPAEPVLSTADNA
jgi:tetratricopeptide (TPR) repeat protein